MVRRGSFFSRWWIVWIAALAACESPAGDDPADQPDPSGVDGKSDTANAFSPTAIEKFDDDARFVVRRRLDLSEQAVVELTEQPFSHRSRRWHVFPFAAYGEAAFTVSIQIDDAEMADASGVWLYGPRRDDGSWGDPKSAETKSGKAKLEISTRAYGQYAVVIGPRTAGDFLTRFPGHKAQVRFEDTDGDVVEDEVFIVRDGDAAYVERRGDDGTVRRSKMIDPPSGHQRVDATELIWTEDGSGRSDGIMWFDPLAWSRSTWFVSKTSDDLRLGFVNEPYEGIIELIDPASPANRQEFHILHAVGADGVTMALDDPNLVDAALFELVPRFDGGREIVLETIDDCDPDAVSTGMSCLRPAWLTDSGTTEIDPGSDLVRVYRPLHVDFDEPSTYGVRVECKGECAPEARPTRYPVYFAHGFNSSAHSWVRLFPRIAELEGWKDLVRFDDPNDEDGDEWREPYGWLYAASVPGFEPVPRRADALRRNLEVFLARLETEGFAPPGSEPFMRLNIVAHSMGGLDSRYLAGHDKYNHERCDEALTCGDAPCCTDAAGDAVACCPTDRNGHAIQWRHRIVSITTLSTPHCGSSFASWGVRQLESGFGNWAFRRVARYVFGRKTDEEVAQLADTLYALSNEYCHDVMSAIPAPIGERIYDWQCAIDEECAARELDGMSLPVSDGETKVLPGPAKLPTIFSWASKTCFSGSCGDTVDAELLFPFKLVVDREGPNDGVVATQSAQFGIFMGIRANDHFRWTRLRGSGPARLVNWLFGVKPEPVFEWYGYWLEMLRRAGY